MSTSSVLAQSTSTGPGIALSLWGVLPAAQRQTVDEELQAQGYAPTTTPNYSSATPPTYNAPTVTPLSTAPVVIGSTSPVTAAAPGSTGIAALLSQHWGAAVAIAAIGMFLLMRKK